MKIEFSNKLDKVLSSEKQIKKAFGENANSIIKKLHQIKTITSFKEFWSLPGNCHELSFQAKGVYAFWLKHPLRLVFRFIEEFQTIVIIAIEDYHKTNRIAAYNNIQY